MRERVNAMLDSSDMPCNIPADGAIRTHDMT